MNREPDYEWNWLVLRSFLLAGALMGGLALFGAAWNWIVG